MNKILLFILTSIISSACTSVEVEVKELANNKIALSTHESSIFHNTPKASLIYSPENGGQIESILWQGENLLYKNIIEHFPNKKLDFSNVKAQLTNDGESVIVTNRKRGIYQLRRTYSIKYNQETNEHIIEVIYTAKNYSSKAPLNYQWEQILSLNKQLSSKEGEEKSLLEITLKSESPEIGKISLRLECSGLNDSSTNYSSETKRIHLSSNNGQMKTLGTKERLSWKVLYRLREIED
ncbi:MAG: hypothetical protein HRT88_18155 [Lentisphaeraceae bacterium]|nr:hypothetical protein [Lentisphaeraceae bacterium]